MKERTQKLPVKIGEDEHIHPEAEDLLLKVHTYVYIYTSHAWLICSIDAGEGPGQTHHAGRDESSSLLPDHVSDLQSSLASCSLHYNPKIRDWKKVPNSAHDGSGIPKQMFGGRATAVGLPSLAEIPWLILIAQNDVHIPVGTAYEPGLVPFPWFEHVSSQMQEVEPTDEGARPTTDPISTLLEADIHDLELPLTEAPVSTKFTRRLKHWWKRKHTMEVKPDTEGECRLLEGLVL